MESVSELIRQEVTSWPGVTVTAHRFGGTEYLYGKKEMGHVHGDRLADLPLPRDLHDRLIADGRAQPHHVLPETGWVSVWIDGPRRNGLSSSYTRPDLLHALEGKKVFPLVHPSL